MESDPASEIGRVPAALHVSDSVALVVLCLLELAALAAIVVLWRKKDRSVAVKVAWTLMMLVPAAGLVTYLVWGDPPPPNGPTDRSSRPPDQPEV